MLHLRDGVWKNWSGSVEARPSQVYFPETETELQRLVEQATGTLRVVGAGHSFPPVAQSNETIVSLERYTGIVDVDHSAKQVTVKSGTPLSDLTAGLADHGLMLENMGDINKQTIAGALATGTHGTGTDFGIMATQASGLRLITAAGDVVDVSDDNRFRFAQVSIGVLGVVSTVTLDVVADYQLQEQTFPASVDEVLADLSTYRDHRNFEFWWFPHTDTAFVKLLDTTTQAGQPSRMAAIEERLENLVWEGVCRVGHRAPKLSSLLNKGVTTTFSQSEQIGQARAIYPTTREVRFNETEYGVPRGDAAEVFRELRDVVEAHNVMFPVEFRDVAGDNIPLSPAYNRDSTFVAVHAYHRRPYEELIQDVEEIFDQYDGRPHWGKHHTKSASDLESLYPEWEAFRELQADLDPDALFCNPYLQTLFGR